MNVLVKKTQHGRLLTSYETQGLHGVDECL